MNGITGLLALVLVAAPPADPRIPLVEAQVVGADEKALQVVEQLLATPPAESQPPGLEYLRGHLLERLEQPQESLSAFLAALSQTPDLSRHGYFRLALEYERIGHPEMAAGLVAKVVAAGRAFPEIDEASRLLRRTLGAGGDCRLLGTLRESRLPMTPRREVHLSRIECALRKGEQARARALVISLLAESRSDEPAYQAAELAATHLLPERDPELALTVGLTLHEHREFARSNALLDRAFAAEGLTPPLLGTAAFRSHYARLRNDFWLGDYRAAADGFEKLSRRTADAERQADALFQYGRCLELDGDWTGATAAFRRVYQADPNGSWAGAGLIAALRLEWRSKRESSALELYDLLLRNRRTREHASRAALFLAASDLVRERSDRASLWLLHGERLGAPAVEVAYWRGRLAELVGDRPGAVGFYVQALKENRHHPFGVLAGERLASSGFAPVTRAVGMRLSVSPDFEDQVSAWLLLGEGYPRSQELRRVLISRLEKDPATRVYLDLAEVPVPDWPLWRTAPIRAEDLLLALGLWREGAPAIGRHFPLTDPSLAFTAAHHLVRAGELRPAVRILEILEQRRPAILPQAFLPASYRRLLYPLPYRENLLSAAAEHGVDPTLLAAIIREESRFDVRALSGSSARGLTQFTQPTAQRYAGAIGRETIGSEDLYSPEISIALGAAYLAELGALFRDLEPAVVASYNAGENQARVWISHCFSRDPAEYLSKISFRQTRDYVGRVLTSQAQYREIYGEEIADAHGEEAKPGP